MEPLALVIERFSYILAAVSAIATLAGLGFAIYGWYNLNHVERLVDQRFRERMTKIEKDLLARQIRAEEATQKIMSGYMLMGQGKVEQAAALFRSAVEIEPNAFNGYTSLGYAYFELGRKQEAIEAFREAAARFPDRHEPLNDLARIFAGLDESELALKYISATLARKPEAINEIEQDPIFDRLRGTYPSEYKAAISGAPNSLKS